jgi:hypothetical protein
VGEYISTHDKEVTRGGAGFLDGDYEKEGSDLSCKAFRNVYLQWLQ